MCVCESRNGHIRAKSEPRGVAAPLLLFHAATKRLPLVAVGMFQYIAPTITLGLATFVYDEPFTPSHGFAFGLVWVGLAIFTVDSVRRATQANRLDAAGAIDA